MSESKVFNNIKQRRLLADLTQEDLAQRSGVTRQTILAIEKGNYTPSVYLALKLAACLGCKVEDLFYVEESE